MNFKSLLDNLKDRGVLVGLNSNSNLTVCGHIKKVTNDYVILQSNIRNVVCNRLVPFDKIYCVEYEGENDEF